MLSMLRIDNWPKSPPTWGRRRAAASPVVWPGAARKIDCVRLRVCGGFARACGLLLVSRGPCEALGWCSRALVGSCWFRAGSWLSSCGVFVGASRFPPSNVGQFGGGPNIEQRACRSTHCVVAQFVAQFPPSNVDQFALPQVTAQGATNPRQGCARIRKGEGSGRETERAPGRGQAYLTKPPPTPAKIRIALASVGDRSGVGDPCGWRSRLRSYYKLPRVGKPISQLL